MTLTIGTSMNTYSPSFTWQTATIHTDTKANFMAALMGLKKPGYANKLHLHEQLFTDDNPDSHTLEDCEQANRADVNLSNPKLFQGTYTHNGELWIAWGFVAYTDDSRGL